MYATVQYTYVCTYNDIKSETTHFIVLRLWGTL